MFSTFMLIKNLYKIVKSVKYTKLVSLVAGGISLTAKPPPPMSLSPLVIFLASTTLTIGPRTTTKGSTRGGVGGWGECTYTNIGGSVGRWVGVPKGL